MKNDTNGMISGVISAGLFLLFLLAFRGGLLISAAVGTASYVICAFLIFRKKKVVIVADGVTQQDMQEILAEGVEKLDELKAASLKISEADIRTKLDNIISAASSIYADIQKDPKNIRQARKFISYYMDTTGYIVHRYIEISADRSYLNEGDDMLGRISDSLDSICALFKKLKGKLMEDDLFDLDTEIKLLEQTIKSEGI